MSAGLSSSCTSVCQSSNYDAISTGTSATEGDATLCFYFDEVGYNTASVSCTTSSHVADDDGAGTSFACVCSDVTHQPTHATVVEATQNCGTVCSPSSPHTVNGKDICYVDHLGGQVVDGASVGSTWCYTATAIASKNYMCVCQSV